MIIVKIGGGLGNQMFMCAYAKTLQKRGYKVKLDVETFFQHEQEEIMKTPRGKRQHIMRNCDLEHFNVDIPFVLPSKSVLRYLIGCRANKELVSFLEKVRLLHFYDWCNNKYSDRYLKEMVQIKNNSYIYGYFANEKFFRRYRKDILEMFTPKQEVDFTESFFERRNSQIPLVSVHFRRTDYKYTTNLDIADMQYYKEAVTYLQNKIGNFDICAFSDDIEWVKENFAVEGIQVLYAGDDKQYQDYEELYLMSKCDHNIIANSTFSWWGAWLNRNPDKIVIAPKKWYNNRKSRIVPESWVQL